MRSIRNPMTHSGIFSPRNREKNFACAMSLTRSSGFGVMVESSPAWEMLMNVPAVSFIILNAKNR